MRLTLPPLSRDEIRIALRILSLDPPSATYKRIDKKQLAKAGATQEEVRRSSVADAVHEKRAKAFFEGVMSLEKTGSAYARKVARPAKLKNNIWRYYFAETEPDDVRIQTILREWRGASEVLRENVGKRAAWCPMPQLALPAKTPIPAITLPADLVLWLSVRAIANRQFRFFVKCKLCGKFTVRERSTAAYCSSKCQRLAVVERTYKKRGADFGEYLTNLPEDQRLPPRMELQRTIAAQRSAPER